MGFLSDIFFGTDSTSSAPKKKTITGGWSPLEDDYDDYYEQIHDDAMSGDLEAQSEMREEFGDDWEGEY